MKYQKAAAEVVRFGTRKVFMKISSGKRCAKYSVIDGVISCFDVDPTGDYDSNTTLEKVVCNDVTPGESPRIIWSNDVQDYWGDIVP